MAKNRFEGTYYSEESEKSYIHHSNDLSFMKKRIEQYMAEDNYSNYTTAWITEYSRYNRKKSYHYFSIRNDKKWVKVEISLFNYSSYEDAKNPIKYIMRLFLTITGYKRRQLNEQQIILTDIMHEK